MIESAAHNLGYNPRSTGAEDAGMAWRDRECKGCGQAFEADWPWRKYCETCSVTCSVEGCGRPTKESGMCSMHLSRRVKHGDAGTAQRQREWQSGPCSVEGCEREAEKRGYCGLHYKRVRDKGSPGPANVTTKPRGVPCEVVGCTRLAHSNGLCSMHASRLRFRADIGPAEPLIAPAGSGHLTKKGYRLISVDGRLILEHRYVMEQKIGRRLTRDETVHHVRDESPEDKANNDLSNLELWSSRHPSGQRVEDKIAFVIEMAKLYPQYLAAQGFRMMPLESAEATKALLGEPSFKDFDAAAVLRRWTNA